MRRAKIENVFMEFVVYDAQMPVANTNTALLEDAM